MLEVFFKGFILGFAIAAPVGPVAIMCIRKTLQFSKLSGFLAGLGASAADALFASLAAFGLTFLSTQLISFGYWLKLFGSILLLFLSFRSFRSKPHEPKSYVRHISLLKDIVGTFFLTLSNPLTLLFYFAVFATLGFGDLIQSALGAPLLILGVFFGSAFWFLILTEGIGLIRHKMTDRAMIWINRAAGILIGAFGIWGLTSLLF